MSSLFLASLSCFAATFVSLIVMTKAESDSFLEGAAVFVSVVMTIVGGLSLVIFTIFIFGWVAAEHKARILNAEYGTSYTRDDVFYASDVIDTVRNLDRKRIEVKGELTTHEKE